MNTRAFFHLSANTCANKGDRGGHQTNQNKVSDKKGWNWRKEGYLCSLKQTTIASEPSCACLCCTNFSQESRAFPPLVPGGPGTKQPVLDGYLCPERKVESDLTWAPPTESYTDWESSATLVVVERPYKSFFLVGT